MARARGISAIDAQDDRPTRTVGRLVVLDSTVDRRRKFETRIAVGPGAANEEPEGGTLELRHDAPNDGLGRIGPVAVHQRRSIGKPDDVDPGPIAEARQGGGSIVGVEDDAEAREATGGHTDGGDLGHRTPGRCARRAHPCGWRPRPYRTLLDVDLATPRIER